MRRDHLRREPLLGQTPRNSLYQRASESYRALAEPRSRTVTWPGCSVVSWLWPYKWQPPGLRLENGCSSCALARILSIGLLFFLKAHHGPNTIEAGSKIELINKITFLQHFDMLVPQKGKYVFNATAGIKRKEPERFIKSIRYGFGQPPGGRFTFKARSMAPINCLQS